MRCQSLVPFTYYLSMMDLNQTTILCFPEEAAVTCIVITYLYLKAYLVDSIMVDARNLLRYIS